MIPTLTIFLRSRRFVPFTWGFARFFSQFKALCDISSSFLNEFHQSISILLIYCYCKPCRLNRSHCKRKAEWFAQLRPQSQMRLGLKSRYPGVSAKSTLLFYDAYIPAINVKTMTNFGHYNLYRIFRIFEIALILGIHSVNNSNL